MDLATTSCSDGSRTTENERGLPFKRGSSTVSKASAALRDITFSSKWQPLQTAPDPGFKESARDKQGECQDETSETAAVTEVCRSSDDSPGQSNKSLFRKSSDFNLGEPEGGRSKRRSFNRASSSVQSTVLHTGDHQVRGQCRRRLHENNPETSSCEESPRHIVTGGGAGCSVSAAPSSWEDFPDSGCVSESSRDGFSAIFEGSLENKDPQLPSSFSMLFRSPLHISPLRAALENLTPSSSPALRRRHDSDGSSSSSRELAAAKDSFKRPGSPSHPLRTLVLKRGLDRNKKKISFDEPRCSPKVESMPRSLSAADIDTALEQADKDPSLIGNFTKKCALPLVEGAAHDLKTITPSTLADLLRGKFDPVVDDFTVVDCRYPFEYLGGHIRGAVNIFEPRDLFVAFLEGTCLNSSSRRHVLVFHCEFSSERAPRLARLLRREDRQLHMDVYPQLLHPEVYLLQRGYKVFHEMFEDLCEPPGYVPMRHEDYEAQLALYRGHTKSTSKRRKARYVRPPLSRPSSQQ